MRDWVITTSGDRSIEEIAGELARCGFQVDQVLSEVGLITGRATEDAVAKARKVAGVADVSANVSIDVGPPGSRHTW
jgi:hypothetical protein